MPAPARLSSEAEPKTAAGWNVGVVDLGLIALLGAAVLTFYKNLILVHFYVNGAYIWDSGFLARLTWRNGLIPQAPVTAMLPDELNFLQTHSFLHTPFLSLASYLFPCPMAVWFAWVYGLFHALTALVAYFIFRFLLGSGLLARWGAFASAGLLMFSPVVTENLRYPHLECFWFPGAAMVVLGLLMRRSWLLWAGIVFAAATREDCGFHLAAPFLLTLLLGALFPRFFGRIDGETWKRYTGVAIAGVILSLGSTLVPNLFVVKIPALAKVYAGQPFYGHLTAAFLDQQALFFLTEKAFLWGPLLILLVAGTIRRDVIFVAASLAGGPWLLFNLTAWQDGAHRLESYHVFPLFLAFLFACLPRPGVKNGAGTENRWWRRPEIVRVGVIDAALVTSLVLWPFFIGEEMAGNLGKTPSSEQIAQTEHFYKELPALRAELGELVANAPVVGVAPERFSLAESQPQFHISPTNLADSVVVFGPSWDQENLWPALMPSYHMYQVKGTRLFVATRRPKENLPMLRGLAEPVPAFCAMMYSSGPVTNDAKGMTLGPIHEGNAVIFGPNLHLPTGHYRVTFSLERETGEAAGGCLVDVGNDGKELVSAAGFAGAGELRSEPVLEFEVMPGESEKHFEFRVFQKGERAIRLRNLVLERTAD